MHMFQYISVEKEQPDLLSEWTEFRTEAYLQCGFVANSDLDEDGVYRDHYDVSAEHILMKDACDSTTIGTFRLINGTISPLPVEREYGVGGGVGTCEISALAVMPRYRKTFATFGCYWLAYQRSQSEGLKDIYAIIEKPLFANLADVGLPVRSLGKEKRIFNTWNYPVQIKSSETVASLREADARRGGSTRLAEQIQAAWTGFLDTSQLYVSEEPRK